MAASSVATPFAAAWYLGFSMMRRAAAPADNAWSLDKAENWLAESLLRVLLD